MKINNMTQKEKAKAYDEALERARIWKDKSGMPADKQGILDDIFPELKESEDEKIRKEIINFLELPHPQFVGKRDHEKWISWLEKQDPKKHEEELEKAYKTADKVQYRRGYEDATKEMEKQGESYTKKDIADLNEFVKEYSFNISSDIYNLLPKEKQSTWINEIESAVRAGAQWYEKQDEQKQEINNFDVLPGLYKCVHRMFDGTPDGRLLFEVGNVYRCLSKHDRAEFEVSYGHSVYLEDPVVCKHFIPFEKQGEQKPSTIDIDKMVDDYANNKERGNEEFGKPVPCMIRAYRQGLNDAIGKVVLKPAWSEEDEKTIHNIDAAIRHEVVFPIDELKSMEIWLESLKYRICPKHEWKRDEKMFQLIEDIINVYRKTQGSVIGGVHIEELKDFLNCIASKQEWKPSDEQMEALWNMLCECRPADHQLLQDIYYGLKKLREEQL